MLNFKRLVGKLFESVTTRTPTKKNPERQLGVQKFFYAFSFKSYCKNFFCMLNFKRLVGKLYNSVVIGNHSKKEPRAATRGSNVLYTVRFAD